MNAPLIGIDIGGTGIKAGLLNPAQPKLLGTPVHEPRVMDQPQPGVGD